MKNGWTGGQFSVFRIALGIYLTFTFIQLLPYSFELFSNIGVLPDHTASPIIFLFPNLLAYFDTPYFVVIFVAAAGAISIFYTIGLYTRVSALLLWYIIACLVGRNPLVNHAGLPFLGWILLAHVVIPASPVGSFDSKKRDFPNYKWEIPQLLYVAAWILLAVGYTYSGVLKVMSPSWVEGTAIQSILHNSFVRPGFIQELALAIPEPILMGLTWGILALECLFAPLAFFKWARPSIWLLMVLVHILLIAFVDLTDFSAAMLLVHFFTFNPDWVKPTKRTTKDTLFYDGVCGLCHHFVRFVLAEDRAGELFEFSPLHSNLFKQKIPNEISKDLPDSIVLLKENGDVLTKSDAAISILKSLGGLWKIIGVALFIIPRPLRNLGYDIIAKIRYYIFPEPDEVCPIMPQELRNRFVV